MIRSFVLIGLLATIFYCAVARPVRAEPAAAVSKISAAERLHRQFIPGSMVAFHAPLHSYVAEAKAAVSSPNA